MSVDSFIHFSISERLHVDKKFFSKHPEFKFDKLNDRIRTQVNEYIKENKTSDLLFTEKHVKYIRNCYAFLLGKYGNKHMNEKLEGYDYFIEDFLFDFDQATIEDIVSTLTDETTNVDAKNALRDDIFNTFTVVTTWINNRWKLYLDEKAVKEAEEEAKRKEQIEKCVNIQRFGAEYQTPLTYDVQPTARNQHRRMNRKGKSVAGKK